MIQRCSTPSLSHGNPDIRFFVQKSPVLLGSVFDLLVFPGLIAFHGPSKVGEFTFVLHGFNDTAGQASSGTRHGM